jgi:hypothetical protein
MTWIQQFNIEDEHVLQRDEQRAQKVHVVKEKNGSGIPA